MKLAAIDIGTNSTKTTFAESSANGSLTVLREESEVTRLGEGVDAARRLSDAAMDRTLAAVVRFADAARRDGAEKVVAAGTSALRDAANGPEFLVRLEAEAGVRVEIISGDREAQFAYAAVASDPTLTRPADRPLLVFDIGGGSTELVLGNAEGVGRFQSLDIGAVRLTERFLHSDPPTTEEMRQAQTAADAALAAFPRPDAPPVIAGIGGTALNLAAVRQGHRDMETLHGSQVSRGDIEAGLARLLALPLTERKAIPGLEPQRADILPAGALILSRILEYFGADEFLLSVRGLRYGLLAEAAKA